MKKICLVIFFFRIVIWFLFSATSIKDQYKIYIFENIELKKSNEDRKKKIQTLEENLSQANKTDESSIIKKLRKEITCLTKDFGNFLESSNTLTMILIFNQHPHDKFGLRLEKGASSSKSQFVLDKCDFYGKSGNFKFRCIHKKKKMSKGTNAYGPKKIWVPKS